MALLLLVVGALFGLLVENSAAFAVLGAVVGGALDIRNFLRARKNKKEAEQDLELVKSRLTTLEHVLSQLHEAVQALEARTETAGVTQTGGEAQKRLASTFTKVKDDLAVAESASVDAVEPLSPRPTSSDVSSGEITRGDETDVSQTLPAPSDTEVEPISASFIKEDEAEGERAAGDDAPPSFPSPLERVLTFFTGGNTVARVGTVLLTIGLGFLVQFAAREGWLPIELRLSAVGLVGAALVAVGWRLRKGRPGYGLSLQGGGIGVAYLTVFAAMQLYGLVPNALGFGLLVAIVAAAALLAVLQDALALAFLGAVGGFLAPFFSGGEGGSHVVLFGYYLVLNIGILLIAWRKAWRPLNILGYVATFVTGGLWGGLNYSPRLFASTEPFLLAFFLLYLAVAVLYALRQPPRLRGLMDGTLVFTLPAVAFGLQVALVRRFELGVAFSALGFAAVYLLLALVLFRRAPKELGVLAEAFTAIGLVFTALVLPFAFEAHWVSAGWALGGAGLVWIGVRQRRLWLRLFGLGWQLLGLAALGLIVALSDLFGRGPSFNVTLDAVASALGLLFSAYTLHQGEKKLRAWERVVSPLYLSAGLLSWGLAGRLELSGLPGYDATAFLLFVSVSLLLCALLAKRLKWAALDTAALTLPLVLALFALALYAGDDPNSVALLLAGALSWLVAFSGLVWLLQRAVAETRVLAFLHVLGLWVVTAVLLYYSAQVAERVTADWSVLVALAPATALLWLLADERTRGVWLKPSMRPALLYGLTPLAALTWAVGLLLNALVTGDATPLPYLPLLNPLDLSLGFILLLLVRTLLRVRAELEPPFILRRSLTWALIAYGLLWTSGILARSVHHWLGVPYSFGSLFASNVLQTSLSIFWTLFALVAMLVARRRGSRTPWLVGAGLLALVVLKLFFVDIANASVLARIVSFIGVGVLLLLIGYLAPLPPTQARNDTSRKEATESVIEEGAA